MILFLFLVVICLYIFFKHSNLTKYNPIFIFIIPLVTYLLFLSEHLIFNIPYFISDELGYIHQQPDSVASFNDRITWYVLNTFLLRFDIFPNLSLKLINIPIFFIAVFYLWRMFDFNNNVFTLIFFLPYFNIVAICNFRDIFALVLLIMAFYYSIFSKNWIKFFIVITLLFFTRYFLVFIIALLFWCIIL